MKYIILLVVIVILIQSINANKTQSTAEQTGVIEAKKLLNFILENLHEQKSENFVKTLSYSMPKTQPFATSAPLAEKYVPVQTYPRNKKYEPVQYPPSAPQYQPPPAPAPQYQPPPAPAPQYQPPPPPAPAPAPQYQTPSAPQYQTPPAPQYQTPSAPQYQTPLAPQYQTPLAPQYQTPLAPQYQPPSAPQYQPPSAPQYQPPSAPQYQPPSAPQYQPPLAPQYQPPQYPEPVPHYPQPVPQPAPHYPKPAPQYPQPAPPVQYPLKQKYSQYSTQAQYAQPALPAQYQFYVAQKYPEYQPNPQETYAPVKIPNFYEYPQNPQEKIYTYVSSELYNSQPFKEKKKKAEPIPQQSNIISNLANDKSTLEKDKELTPTYFKDSKSYDQEYSSGDSSPLQKPIGGYKTTKLSYKSVKNNYDYDEHLGDNCEEKQAIYEGDYVAESYCRCSSGSYGFSCNEGYANPCSSSSGQFYPADSSLPKSYFIHCSNSSPYLKKCAGSLVWNQDVLTCDWGY